MELQWEALPLLKSRGRGVRGKKKKEVYCSDTKVDKSKVFPFQAVKALEGSGGLAPLILNLGTRGMRVVDFTPRPLYHRGRTSVPSK